MRIDLEEEQKLVLENEKLVYYIAKKYVAGRNDEEDIQSIGKIGLIKAASTFDTSKGNTFATYASRCIKNEILMYFRREKKYENVVSLDDVISMDNDGHELLLRDKIPSSDKEFTEEIEESEAIINVINIILNCLMQRERIVMLYKIAGMKQKEIGEKLELSQSYISRIDQRSIKKVKTYIDDLKQFDKVFMFEEIYELYRISFHPEYICKYAQNCKILFQKLKEYENSLNFKVSYNNQRIIILLPADLQSFISIAQIIQKIDEFKINESK